MEKKSKCKCIGNEMCSICWPVPSAVSDEGKEPKCGYSGDYFWCHCGKCKQSDYPLPKDFPTPPQTPPESKKKKVYASGYDVIILNEPEDSTPPSPQKESGWEEEFMDFYYENGKYRGRRLGPEQYIKFIQSLLSSEHQKAAQRIALLEREVEGLRFNEEGYKNDDTLGRAMNLTIRAGYNQALDDVLKLLTDKK